MNFSCYEICIIAIISLLNFTLCICAFLQAPFYPNEATKKGATATEYSIVFGCYQLTCLIFTPIFGKTISNKSLKCFFTFGMVAYSVSTFVFGFLQYVYGTLIFISISCFLRIIEGIGAACGGIAATTIGISLFPDRAPVVFATLEVCYGAGMIFGPFIGAILYTIGGFILPFTSVGAVSAIIGAFAYFVIPRVPEKSFVLQNEAVGIFDLVKITWIFINSILVVTSGISHSFLSTLLEQHLNETFGVSVQDVGYIFALTGVAYCIAGILCSAIISRWPINKQISLLGCFITLMGFSIIGPVPYFPYEGSVTLSVFGMVLFGIGTGFINVISFSNILLSAEKAGYPNNVSTYALVSCIWLTCMYFGYVVGSCSGMLYDIMGFSYSSLIVIVMLMIAMFIIFTEWMRNNCGRYTAFPSSYYEIPVDASSVLWSEKLSPHNKERVYGAVERS